MSFTGPEIFYAVSYVRKQRNGSRSRTGLSARIKPIRRDDYCPFARPDDGFPVPRTPISLFGSLRELYAEYGQNGQYST
jgi:hypothetical protein